MSLFLQKSVKLREEVIKRVYGKQCPPLSEERDQHIECLRHQSNTTLEELRKSEATIVHERNQLTEVYRELMTMSQRPYQELLVQVSMECLKELHYLRTTPVAFTSESPFYSPCTYQGISFLRKIWPGGGGARL